MTSPTLNGAAAALADTYEFELPDGRVLRCTVPTLADVSRITALQFVLERARFATDDAAIDEGQKANLELYELLPRALGLDPTQVRLLPREIGRLAADFFARNRFPDRTADGKPAATTAQALPQPAAEPEPAPGPGPGS